MDFKVKPFPHQIECFDYAKDKDAFALLLEPGLGKTKISIDIVTYRKNKYKDYPTLVVCPSTIVENWAKEINFNSDLSSSLLTGTKNKRIKNLNIKSDFYIINYEGVRLIKDELIDRKFSSIILDESQCVKNKGSLQSKACFDVSQRIPHRSILTGTPIMNNPLDIFAQYRVIDPSIFGLNYFRFRSYYCIMGGYGNHQPIQWINMDRFRSRLFSCAIRKRKDECLDLPDKLYQTINLEMPEEQTKVYHELRRGFISEFNQGVITAPVMLTRILRFSQITSGFTKDEKGVQHDFKSNPKVDWVVDFLKNTEGKVVIFCRFIREIEMLEKRLGKELVTFTRISGEIKDRFERIEMFNSDPACRVFIAELKTGGVGINLTSASYCIFMSNDYSYGTRLQAEDRTMRIGQTRNVTYIDLVMKGTIDENMLKILKKKESISSMVVDNIAQLV